MDQRTSPTRWGSRRQYINNLPPHRKSEIISRREWTIFTSLSNLPRTCRLGGRHRHISNEGIAQADDSKVGEEEDSDDEDEDNNHLNFLRDCPRFDNDGDEVFSDFVPSDQVDEEDEEDEDYEEDKVDGEDKEDEDDKDRDVDVDVDVDVGFLDEDEDKDEDKDKDEDEDEDEDEVEDKDKADQEDEDAAVLNSDAFYSATTVDPNYEDDHSSLPSIEEDHLV